MDHDNRWHRLNFLIGAISFLIGLVFYIVAFFVKTPLNAIFNIIATVLAGYVVVMEGLVDTIKDSIRKKGFYPNIHLLMALGAIGAIIIKEYSEAALLIIIFAAANFLEEYADNKSRKEISSLMKLNPKKARRINADGSIEIIPVSEVKKSDHLQVLNGDQVPTDGVILSGTTTINQAFITGESMPVDKAIGDEVFGATMNGDGSFVMEVTKDNENTVFAKILQLVKSAQQNISKTASMIKRIEPIYVTCVLLIAPLFYLLGNYVFGWDQQDSFYRTMVFLIGASPCALAASDIPATLASISNLAKRGVLFKGGSYLSNMNDIKAIAFDKTGTLTKGEPSVTDVYFVSKDKEDISQYEHILYSMETQSNHPLAKAIVKYYNKSHALKLEVTNILGVGLSTKFEGSVYRIGKPSSSPSVCEELVEKGHIYENDGKTIMFFAKDEEVIGIIAVLDEEKEASRVAIDYFKKQGIHTVLITGDTPKTGEAIGARLGIDEVRADVLPDQKATIIQDLKSQYGVVAMIGDGVNDAPALVTADIGIAMGEGTDIAIDVSDVVLMKNDISKVIYTHKVAKKLRHIVLENIIFAMSVVLLLMIVNLFDIRMTLAVTVHEGSTVLVLLNGLRMLVKVDK